MTVASIEADLAINSIIKKLVVDSKILTPTAKVIIPVIDNFALPLKRIPYIHHPIWFKKDKAKVKIVLNSNNEVNTIILVYMAKLGLNI